MLQAIGEQGLQAAIELSQGALLEGAAPWALSPESASQCVHQAGVAQADGPADRSEDFFSSEWRWWDH